MKMSFNANGSFQIIEESDDDSIIFSDKSVFEWDKRIRREFSLADNKQDLDELMKNYLKSAQEIAINFDDSDIFRKKVASHLSFLYSYYIERQCCMAECYLENMENILTLYCNLEMEYARRIKKKRKKDRRSHSGMEKPGVEVCRRIIYSLTVYLLDRREYILHVLIKMKMYNSPETCKGIINLVFSHFLMKAGPNAQSDEAFCRSYILFRKWKEIQKVEEWKRMDDIMYKMFNKTPESVKNNDTLRHILKAEIKSTADVVLKLFSSFQDLSSAYFKHVAEKKNVELDEPSEDLDLIILEEESPQIKDEDEENDDIEFLSSYNDVDHIIDGIKPCHQLSPNFDISRRFKQEDDDDEVEFVAYYKKDAIIDITPAQRPKTPVGPPIPSPTPVESVNVNEPIPVVEKPQETTITTASVSTSTAETFTKPSDSNHQSVVEITTTTKTVVETRTVEIQTCVGNVNSNHPYNDYGFITPPSDAPVDENPTQHVPNCVYPDIVQGGGQVDDYVTSPSDSETTLKPSEGGKCDSEPLANGMTHCVIPSDSVSAVIDSVVNRVNGVSDVTTAVPQPAQSAHSIDNHAISTTRQPNKARIRSKRVRRKTTTHSVVVPCSTGRSVEEVTTSSVEVRTDLTADPPNVIVEKCDYPWQNHIDTGQTVTSTVLDAPPPAAVKTLWSSDSTNGKTILKPLFSPNLAFHDAAKEVERPPSLVRDVTLEKFSQFEDSLWNNRTKENYDFNCVMSGPVTQMTPRKNNHVMCQDELDLFGVSPHEVEVPLAVDSSRSNSPSPAYEVLDERDRIGFRRSLNHSPSSPPHRRSPPPGILKNSATQISKKKNLKVLFDVDECVDHRYPVVVVERDPDLDRSVLLAVNKLKAKNNLVRNEVRSNPPDPGSKTIRVDYRETDDRAMAEVNPRLSFMRPNTGTEVKTRPHLGKKPEKRKYVQECGVIGESNVGMKRVVPSQSRKAAGASSVPRSRKRRPKDPERKKPYLDLTQYMDKPFRLEMPP